MDKKKTPMLRLFLLSIIELVADGKTADKAFIESKIEKGVCTAVKERFPSGLIEELSEDIVEEVNNYYRQYEGCLDERKYPCGEKDGLLWLIALALNEVR